MADKGTAWRRYWIDAPMRPLAFVTALSFIILLTFGASWVSFREFRKTIGFVSSNEQLVLFEPDVLGFVSIVPLLLIPTLFLLRHVISERARVVMELLVTALFVGGIFCLPFAAKGYLNGKIAAAGYLKCHNHPINERKPGRRRSLLPYQLWVLDPADCGRGADWAWRQYRKQRGIELDIDEPPEEAPYQALPPDLGHYALPEAAPSEDP
jgi:hypothetical protein